jgi:polar amino acid transport system substrate-binding protein
MKRWLLSMAMALGTTMVLTPAQAGEPLSFFTEEWIPFNFATESGEVDGFTTAIVKRISQKLGTKVSIELQPWSRALKNAQSTKNSAIYSIYRNQEREKFFS